MHGRVDPIMGTLNRLHSWLPFGVLNPFPVKVADALAHEATADHEINQHLSRTLIHLHKLGAWLRRGLQRKLLGAWECEQAPIQGRAWRSDLHVLPCG